MAFGAQIKLSVDKSNKSQFRGQIQQLVNEASSSNPIKLKNFKVDLSGREKQQIVNQLQETLRNSELTLKIKTIDASSAVANLRKQLTTMLSGLRIDGLKEFLGDSASTQALEKATAAADKLAASQENVKRKAKETTAALREISSINSVLGATNKKILNLGDADGVEGLKEKVRELSAELEKAKNQQGELQAKTIASVSSQTSALVAEVNALKQVETEARRAGEVEVESAQEAENAIKRLNLQRANLSKRVESYIANNPRAYDAYRTQFDAIRASLAEIGDDAPLAQMRLLEISEQFADITTQAKMSGIAGKTFFTTLKEGWQKFGGWSIITKSMMMAINGFKNMVSAVKELDAAMTELKKVTDLTEASYNKFYQSSINRARTVGASLADTINATADFARLGYNIQDAASLAQAALMYKNVGDGINDVSQATESLISTLKAFYSEADDISATAGHIIDAFNEVGNNFAISSTGIGEALQRSAAALSAAGNSLEQSIGLVTAANNVVQNPEQVGTALKTLSMYLRAAKTEAEEAGIETDGMAESVSKLREQILALTGNKVDIQIDENTFKSTYQIIKEISEIWDELSDITRANLTELMGGKRNANVLTALIKNFEDAEKAAKTAMDSIGSAARENEKYLNSIAGKVSQLQAAFQAFSGSALDSSIIKFFVDLGTALLNVGTAITNLHLLVPTITAVAAAIKGISLGTKVNNLVGQFTTQVNAGVPDDTIMATLSRALSTMTVSQQKFAIAQLQTAAAAQTLNPALTSQIGTLAALTTATSATASAGTMLKTVWAGVKATFSSFTGILLVVQLVIAGVQMLVDAHNKSIQESIDKANEYIDAFSSANKNYSSSISTLKGLEKSFEELSEGVDENGKNVSLTSSEYENYLSIIDKIISVSPSVVSGYDSEGRAVLDYKNALQDAVKVQEEYIANQRSIYLGRGNEIFNGKQNEYKQYEKTLKDAGKKFGDIINAGVFNTSHVSEWSSALRAIGVDWRGGVDTWGSSTDILMEIYNKREQFVNTLKSIGTYTQSELTDITAAVYGFGSAVSSMQSILDDQVDYLKEWSREQDWYESIPFGAIDEFAEGLYKVVNPLKSYAENIKTASNYGNEFAAHFGTDTASTLATMATGLSAGTVGVDEFREALESLKDGWEGNANVLDMIISFWESFIPATESATTAIEETKAKVESFSDALKQLKEGYDLLSQAQSEMDKTGTISNNTLQSVVSSLKDGEKLTDYIYEENGLLQLNAEAWRERAEAILQSNATAYTKAIEDTQQLIDDILSGTADETTEEQAAENLEKLREQLSEYEKQLEITNAVIESMHSNWSDPFDTSSLESGIEDIKTEAEGLQEILNRLSDGTALSQEELASWALKYPDIMQNFDLSNADIEEATAVIIEMLDACDSRYSNLIDDQIEYIEGLKEEAEERGYDIGLIDNMIANLQTMKGFNILDLLGVKDKDTSKSLGDFSDVLKEIKNAADTMNDIRSYNAGDGDFISMLQKIVDIANSDEAKNLGKNLSDFVEVIDGKVVFHEADVIEWIDSIIDGLREIKDESGNQVISDELIAQLKEASRAAEEADTTLKDLGDTISDLQSAKSLYQTIQSGDYDILDTLSSVVSMAEKTGKSLSEFFDIGEDGVINFITDGLSSYIDELCDKFIELGGVTPEAAEKLKEYIKTTEKAIDPLDDFSNSLSNLQSAIGILNDINAGDNFLGTLQSIISLVKSTDGESLENFLTITDGKVAFDSGYIRTYIDSVIEAIDTTPEIKSGLRAAAAEALKAKESFVSLSDAISGIENVASFLTQIKSGENNPLSMIQSAMKMAEDLGENHTWTEFVKEGFDPIKGLEWNEDAIRQYSDALVDAALAGSNLEEVLPGITQYLKDQAAVAVEASQSVEELGNGMRSAIEAGNSFGRNTQLTLSAFQQLLDVDKRYASVVDYVNGKLTINRDSYNSLTQSILQETLAEIEARTQTIILSAEYQDLISRIGSLNAAEQSRLDSLNAEIMSYGVLANELNNATSAYQRFMNSSDNDSTGRYAQAVKALGVITDTMENADSEIYGKIGRDQFKLAVDFVLGDNVKVNTPEFEKGLATVRRYLTKDAEGVSNFYDDLVSNGIINATTGAMNTTVQEISQKLGISKEAVRSMLEELERYQEEPFDWSMLDPGSDAEAAESTIQSLEDAVNEAKAAADEAKQAVADLSNEQVTIDVSSAISACGSVSSALTGIMNQINNINKNGKITIKTDVKTSNTGTGGTNILSGITSLIGSIFGRSSASGTQNAPGGKTLVGELGPEIVVDPKTNMWHTVGVNGPEFVNLNPGSVVLNAKQTSSLLGTSKGNSSGQSKAFANYVALDSGGGGKKSTNTNNPLTNLFNTVANGVNNVVNRVSDFIKNAGNGVSGTVTKPTTNSNNNNNNNGGGGGSSIKQEEEEAETLREIYEKVNKELEHLIEHQQFLYKVADRGLDFPGMEASLKEQARLYRKIMENSYAAVEEMKKQGMTDTDEDLQAMERAAWSAYESMYDAFDKIRALYTDSLHTKIDDVQRAYDNLKNAMSELADEGGISIDTFQALTQHGLQYLSFLEDADGQFKVNTDAIKQMIAAEKEQLAVETALSYISSIQEALTDGQVNRVNALVDATQQISDNTWGAVYAQMALLKEMGLTEDQYNQVVFNIEALRRLAGDVITDISDKAEEASEKQEDALDKILEYTEKLVEAETKDRIKAIENEVKAYKKIIDLKKESLKVTKDENSYQRSVSEKVQEIADLQAKIDKLSLDDSRSAQAERAKLIEELAKLQTDLSDYQADHAYEAQVSALDKMSEAYEESRQSEIDALEESISSTEKIYQLAIERIRTGWSTLYNDLITWNTEQGSVINQEITENWNKAGEAVQRYGSYLAALEQVRGLDVGGSLSVLPKYHGGGIVGDAGSISDSEVMAILNKGELVVDEGGKKGLYRIIDFQKSLSERLGAFIGNIMAPNTAGMMPSLAMAGAGVGGGMVFSPTINVEFNHSGDMSDTDARRYGNDIADSALERMYNAFERRGITGIFGTKLKQTT